MTTEGQKPKSVDWLQTCVESSDVCKEAEGIAKDYEPQEGPDYAWVISHAQTQFDQVQGVIDGLDTKASNIITYVSAFAGLSSLALIQQAVSIAPCIGLFCLPTLAFALKAVTLAVKARTPAPHYYPPNTHAALRYAEDYRPGVAEARFALKVWAAFEAGRVVANAKGELIAEAFRAFATAAWFLLLPVAAAIVTRLLGVSPAQ